MWGHSIGRARTAARRAAAAVVVCAAAAQAYPPREPVPIPLFSFDAASPSASGEQGADHVDPDAVLAKGGPNEPLPSTVFSGQHLGLGLPGDELDGLSANRTLALHQRQFVLLFSVGRATVGGVAADPTLTGANAPFNVADQVIRGHAAGDGFISLHAFDSNGVVSATRAGIPNNSQAINNYDEGGQDYQADPPTSSAGYVPPGTPQDNVNASAYSATDPVRGVSVDGLYFSVSPGSPSLQAGLLPGGSGADIFYDPEPDVPGLQQPQQPYASADELGLTAADDIDALVVDDRDANGRFGGRDCVYVSLAPGSPTLAMLPFVSSNGAADVLRICAGPQGIPLVRQFAPAAALGLAGAGDDMDALEVIPCGDALQACDPQAFAADASIRSFPGDWNNDGMIGAADTLAVPACLSGPFTGPGFVPPSRYCRHVFDFNADHAVDLIDFGFFQFVFGSAPGAE